MNYLTTKLVHTVVICAAIKNFKFSFKDIDECSSEYYKCYGTRCINMPGSWSCVCDQGYKNTSVVTENNVSTVQCNSKYLDKLT